MEVKPRVLLVDDDVGLTRSLPPFLQRSGYQVAVAVNGRDALDQIPSFRPHLILLDILMPWVNGREVLRQLRRSDNRTPVIMLTTVTEVDEKTCALDEGADDYITKPFHRNELLSRIRAVLRRAQFDTAPRSDAADLTSCELRLNRRAQTVYLDGELLNVSHKAFQVLEYLMTHRGEVITRERFVTALWDSSAPISTRAVDVRIAELRRALRDDRATPRFIETMPNAGYRFIGPVEVAA